MSRKWNDALRDWRTYVLGALVGILISAVYDKVKDAIVNWGAEVRVDVTSILVSRTQEKEFPECRVAFHLKNEFSDFRTVSFRSLSFLDSGLVCPLTGKTRMFDLAPGSERQDTLRFSSRLLDEFLKAPQGPEKSKFALVGEVTQSGDAISSVIGEKDVDKATYWQIPVLTEADTARLDLVPIEHVVHVYFTDSRGRKGDTRTSATSFTSRWESMELDLTPLKKFALDSASKKLSFLEPADRIERVFKKKYGGFYRGKLSSAPIGFAGFKDAFPDVSQYTLLKMTGLEYERSLKDALEFVYFSFDQPAMKATFADYQRNSSYYVILVNDIGLHNDYGYLRPIADSLDAHGFRVGFDADSMFHFLREVVADFVDSTRMDSAVDFFSSYSRRIDSVIALNRPLVVWLGDTDRQSSKDLYGVISRFYPVDYIQNLSCDLRPMIYKNMPSPYSDMILVFPEFSERTQLSRRSKSFRPRSDRDFFRQYKENSRHYVVLVNETRDSLATTPLQLLSDSLTAVGFRCGFEEDSLLFLLPQAIGNFSDSDQLAQAVQALKQRVPDINRIMQENGYLLLWLGDPEPHIQQRLHDLCAHYLGERYHSSIKLDCRPLVYYNRRSPFSELVFIFSTFPPEAQNSVIEEYKAEHTPSRGIRVRGYVVKRNF